MSNPIIRSSLIFPYRGQPWVSWYLCGDGSTDDQRNAHIAWCHANNCNTVILNLCNEELMSLFQPHDFMGTLDNRRVDLLANYVFKLRAEGLFVAFAFYDGPAIPGGRYHPILAASDMQHAVFIKEVCRAFNPYVSIYLLGCESGRYGWSSDRVEQFIFHIKACAGPGHLVGAHEQSVGWNGKGWYMKRRVPRNADIHCYETSNHPKDGDSRTAADMADEGRFLVANAGGIPVWVAEHNLYDSERSREQSRAIAEIPGVIGIPGPM